MYIVTYLEMGDSRMEHFEELQEALIFMSDNINEFGFESFGLYQEVQIGIKVVVS